MSNQGRPLSPHLSVYRWPITMTLSILHRVSGAALSAGFLVLAAWVISAASGEMAYEQMRALLAGGVGRVLLTGWTFAFFYHLSNGIRHLVWDAGIGLEKTQANTSAWFVVALTIVVTVLYWLLV